MNFRIAKHIHQALPNEIVEHFKTYAEAEQYLNDHLDCDICWIEGKIDGGWYGLA